MCWQCVSFAQRFRKRNQLRSEAEGGDSPADRSFHAVSLMMLDKVDIKSMQATVL